MKVNRRQLRQMIREVMADLEEDALFKRSTVLGLQPEKDIPGETPPPVCKKCLMRHPSGQCPSQDGEGRNLGYGSVKSDDREGRMTRGQLYRIAKYSQSLYDLLRDNDDLPEWVQSKISRAADKMESVYGHMEYVLSRVKD